FVIAGYGPYIRLDLIALGQNLLRAQGFIENRTASEELRDGHAIERGAVFIDALENAFSYAGSIRHGRLYIVLVIDGQVVETILALLIHTADAVLNDDGQLIGIGWIVNRASGNGAEQYRTVAVLMLQALAQ